MYSAQLPPSFGTDPELTEYIYRQLQGIEQELLRLQFGGLPKVYEEPDKPREGMFANADGTSWNPGAGAGIYVYHDLTWKKIHA